MSIDYQVHRASVDMSKAFRQFQKADNAFWNDNDDSAVNHMQKGYDLFATALDHLGKAEEESYSKAADEIDKGNNELKKSIDELAKGNRDSASKHYSDALVDYDNALDLLS